MAAPRLSGTSLSVATRLAGTFLAGTLWRQALRDYGAEGLYRLPVASLPPFDELLNPLQAAPPRQWADAGLPAPISHRLSTAGLVAAYQSGKTTPVAVMEQIERRVAANQLGKATWSPFVAMDLARAHADAAAATARYRAGQPLGPLDGVPVPLKDQTHIAGLPTRGGTGWRNTPETADSFLVRTLRAAGAVVYAKTHTTEWGMSPLGFNPNFDMPRNVYDAERGAGGSSTGAAVAVALGLATVASGSDGGGSIRIPSAFNGLFGLKPTCNRVGRSGDIFFPSTVAHLGPIGASCADLVDYLTVTAAAVDPDDPLAVPDRATAPAMWRAALGRGVRGCRIGVLRGEWADADAAVVGPAQAALKALEAEGAVLVELDEPLLAVAPPTGMLVIALETAGNLRGMPGPHGTDLELTLRLLAAASASDLLLAQRVRAALRRAVLTLLRGVDVLALPTVAGLPPVYRRAENRIAVVDPDEVRRSCRYTALANLISLPAGAVPVGMSDGLPVSLQIMGDAWDEASVLAVMAHLERLGVTQLPLPEGYARLG